VVRVKPCLEEPPSKGFLKNARADLDSRVKALLSSSPAKFTEWLLQKGLIPLEHTCPIHKSKYQLGKYSGDGPIPKEPLSGGYVWISSCCPDNGNGTGGNTISVFQGSIFESALYNPPSIIKLIYHWACQTSAPNVLQWVKPVSSYYLKNFYTLLRSVCVAALHEFCPLMGGPGKYVEVGIITLGSALNTPKSFKIEILGAFDPVSRVIRLKVLNPGDTIHRSHLLWPLSHWVDKESSLLIDSSIDRELVTSLGFSTVIQSGSGGPSLSPPPPTPTNVNVMNYLKHVVPKMLQNTLCVLSKPLIQQFLDELSWREMWGRSSASTFDTILTHLGLMTKWEEGERLISRLNRISLSPFEEWSCRRKRRDTTLASAKAKAKKRSATTTDLDLDRDRVDLHEYLNTSPRTLSLFTYYFAECINEDFPRGRNRAHEFPPNLSCPFCSKPFLTNLEVIPHLLIHLSSLGSGTEVLCEYCLTEVRTQTALRAHVDEAHKMLKVPFPCVICQEGFQSSRALTVHMWEGHCRLDMPHACGICDYRSSRQTDVVDHFKAEHGGTDSVLCPLCVKLIFISGKAPNSLKALVTHLEGHTRSSGGGGKKCPQCSVSFIHDAAFRRHLKDGAHREPYIPGKRTLRTLQMDTPDILMPLPPARTLTLTPPIKRGRKMGRSSSPSPLNLHFHDYTFYLPEGESETEGYTCLICNQDLLSHDPSYCAGGLQF
jgi:hypothetical protein